jgi:hypothetical protein
LWGESSSSPTSVAVASSAPANQTSVSVPQGLDLFSDRSGTFSS